MTYNKFRAVLTLHNADSSERVMEIGFQGLIEPKTNIKVKINGDIRHKVNLISLMTVLVNLTRAINHYTSYITAKIVISKILGTI